MNEKELKKFKEKHGGYNPHELKIHQRGFWIGLVIFLAVFTLLLIGGLILVSAEIVYTGDSRTFNLDETPDKCEFSGNTYDLEGINFTINEKNVTVSIAQNFKPDNLTLKCFVGKDEPVWYSFGSGGSSTLITTEDDEIEKVEEVNETVEEEEIILDEGSNWKIILILIMVIIGFLLFIFVLYFIFFR